MTDPLFTLTRKKPRPLYRIQRFASELATQDLPHPQAQAHLYCPVCQHRHKLEWRDMQQAITQKGATSLAAIIDAQEGRYCDAQTGPSEAERMARHADHAQALCQELESWHPDVDVQECVWLDKNLYAMKIQTPRGTYLDEGTAADWRALVRRDIAESQRAPQCPLCGAHSINMATNPIRCAHCGAQGWPLSVYPTDLDQWITQYLAPLTPPQALALLREQKPTLSLDDLPDGRTVLWARLPLVCDGSLVTGFEDAVARARGAWNAPAPVTQRIPLLLNTEECPEGRIPALLAAEELDEQDWAVFRDQMDAPIRVPHCGFCRYAWHVATRDSWNTENWYCTYPTRAHELSCDDVSEEGQDSPFPGRGPGLSAMRVQLKSALMGRVLAAFPRVTDPARGREGLEARTGVFHGPLCPDFAWDTDHIELNGEPYRPLKVSVPLVFGVENFAATQAEKARKTHQEALERCVAHLHTLRAHDGVAQRLMAMRIETAHWHTPAAAELLAFIDAQIPHSLLSTSSDTGHLRRFFRVSNKVWEKICERARQHPGG